MVDNFIAKGVNWCVRLTGSSICPLDFILSLDHVDQTLLLIITINVENMSVTINNDDYICKCNQWSSVALHSSISYSVYPSVC